MSYYYWLVLVQLEKNLLTMNTELIVKIIALIIAVLGGSLITYKIVHRNKKVINQNKNKVKNGDIVAGNKTVNK